MGIKENIELDIIGKTIKSTDKPLSDEFADRVRWSALGAITGAAAAALSTPGLLQGKVRLKDLYKLRKVPISVFALGGVPLGWNAPRVHNKYLEYIQGKATKKEAQKAYTKLVEETEDTIKRGPILFKKTAGFLSVTTGLGAGLARGAAATAKRTGGFLGRGLIGSRGTSKFHRLGVRAGFGALAAAGTISGTRLYQSKRRLSGNNYSTFLRNNILAGNIQPNQLSQQDLMSVRRLGMR